MNGEKNSLASTRLQSIEKQIRKRILAGKKNIYELGKFLCEAKRWVAYGEFENWIQEKFGHDFSYPSANNYMNVYQYFKSRPDIVEKIPLTYLLEVIRVYPSEEAIEVIEKILEEDGFEGVRKLHQELRANKAKADAEKRESDHFDKIIVKYKAEEHVKYYQWLTKEIVNRIEYARNIKTRYNTFPELFDSLYSENFPFQPEKTLDVLKKVDAEGFVREIQTAKKILDEAEQSFIKALNHFSNN